MTIIRLPLLPKRLLLHGEVVNATRPAAITEASQGTNNTKSYAIGDVLASIENVTGSRQNDTITGDGVPNVLKGVMVRR